MYTYSKTVLKLTSESINITSADPDALYLFYGFISKKGLKIQKLFQN